MSNHRNDLTNFVTASVIARNMANENDFEAPRPEFKLDAVDWDIIRACRYAPKISNAAIGRQLGISEATVRRRLRALADAGILRFATLVDPSVSEDSVEVLIGVKIDPQRVLPVGNEIAAMREVRYAAVTSGEYDLWIASTFPTAVQWIAFRARLHGLDGVLDTTTFQVAHLLKRTWDWLTPEDRVGDEEDE